MIPKGTIVFTAKPFAHVLRDTHREMYCEYCLKRGVLKICTGCYAFYYCNSECQRKGWPQHKQDCKNLRKNDSPVKDDVRLTARILRQLDDDDDNRKQFFSLDSHVNVCKDDDELMLSYETFYTEFCEFMGSDNVPEFEEMMDIYCRIFTNCFSINNLDICHFAMGFYLLPQTIKHSCKPNLCSFFNGSVLYLVTIEDLPEINWEKFTICYIDTIHTTSQRKRLLKYKYIDVCNCEKCEQPERYALCPNRDCQSPCSIEENKCSQCEEELSDEFKDLYTEIVESTTEGIIAHEYIFDLKFLEFSIRKIKPIVHPCSPLYIKIEEEAYLMQELNKNYFRAISHLKEVMKGYRYHYNQLHFIYGKSHYAMAVLQLNAENDEEYNESLRNLQALYLIWYGEKGSQYFKEIKDKF